MDGIDRELKYLKSLLDKHCAQTKDCGDCKYGCGHSCLAQALLPYTGEVSGDRKEIELEALDRFEKFCEEQNRKTYQKNLANWYIKNYGVSKAKRYNHQSGDDDGLWFNPNEFYGF